MVATHKAHPFRLFAFQEIDIARFCFPSFSILSERSSLSRACSAAPAGAPLTAPGRSEQDFPRQEGKQETKNLRRLPLHVGPPATWRARVPTRDKR
jgi:hypothetical protein